MKNIVILLSLVITALVYQSCTESKAQEVKLTKIEKVITVKTAAVETSTKPIAVAATGILGIKDDVKLSFKIGGIIEAIYVKEGDFVKEGQILAKLNQTEINAQVRQAEIGLKKQERDLKRVENLYKDTVATLEQVEDLTTALDVAKSNVEIAKFNQQFSVIYAPTSGKIQMKLAEKGAVTGPGNPIFILSTNGDAKVLRVALADKDVVRTRIGDRAIVNFDAHPNIDFQGQVVDISENANPMTGTFEVELFVNPKGRLLKNGFIGAVELFPSKQSPYLKIPIEAVVEATRDKVTLYVPNTDQKTVQQVQVQPIEVGVNYFTAVPSNDAISMVITDGVKYLSTNSTIKIVQ